MVTAAEVTAGEGRPVSVRVLPWNNHKAAVSFTYDDADPCHLDIAIPEMDKRGLRGTFFVGPKGISTRSEEWKRAADAGHEIANHSATHPHAKGLTAEQIMAEVDGAKAAIEQATGHRVITFAYPFGEVTPELRQRVAEGHLAARIGLNRIQPLAGAVEWMDIPSMVTLTRTSREEYQEWLKRTADTNGWCVVMVHGIEGTPWGWEPVPRVLYNAVLDEVAARKDEIWTATFGEVAAYLRAQKELEQTRPIFDGKRLTWSWKRPATMPEGVEVKVAIDGLASAGQIRLEQGGKPILPDGQGIYLVSFDAGNLTLSVP